MIILAYEIAIGLCQDSAFDENQPLMILFQYLT